MKILLLVLTLSFLISVSAFATKKPPQQHEPAATTNPAPMPIPEESAYAKLVSLFETGFPAKLSQLPLPSDSSKWQCAGVNANEPNKIMKVNVPVYVQAKIIINPAIPEVPSHGPLFPGTPATPEQYKYIDAIAYANDSRSASLEPDAVGKMILDYKFQLETAPELAHTFCYYAGCANDTTIRSTFRMKDGFIVFLTIGFTKGTEYGRAQNYCWITSQGQPNL